MSIRDSVLQSLQALIDQEGSKAAFAKKIGVSRAAVTNWTSGINAPDIKTIAVISRVYGVPLSAMLEGKVGKQKKSVAENQSWVEVPLYGSIAAGKPIEMFPVEDTFVIPRYLSERYPEAFLLKVVGESMNRVIPNGAYALVNPTQETIDGRAYAVAVNGYDATIKRVYKLANGVELRPDSTDPTMRPMVFDYADPETETVTVIGEVVWYVVPFDYVI